MDGIAPNLSLSLAPPIRPHPPTFAAAAAAAFIPPPVLPLRLGQPRVPQEAPCVPALGGVLVQALGQEVAQGRRPRPAYSVLIGGWVGGWVGGWSGVGVDRQVE